MRYRAPKDIEVSSAGPKGEEIRISFSKGSYVTKDEVEVEILDRLATDPNNPIGFDPKEA
jgi:hypothetical protein